MPAYVQIGPHYIERNKPGLTWLWRGVVLQEELRFFIETQKHPLSYTPSGMLEEVTKSYTCIRYKADEHYRAYSDLITVLEMARLGWRKE